MTKKKQLSLKFIDPLFQKVGELTRVQRLLICCGFFLALVGGVVWFAVLPGYQKIDELTAQKQQLSQTLMLTKRKAKDLKKYREKMKKAEYDFYVAMKQLPDKKEIPSLLAGISNSGKDAGLNFLLFQPSPEVNKQFYAEIPVRITVKGSYHNVGIFFDKVSKLNRIVNIKDITISSGADSTKLNTNCTAVTYRFIETQLKPSQANK